MVLLFPIAAQLAQEKVIQEAEYKLFMIIKIIKKKGLIVDH